jgi:hyaluronoglucosaminidase
MSFSPPRFVGVIEGFYGRAWAASHRNKAASWFSQLGFNTYIYAPKSQVYLRSKWRDAFPDSELALLQAMSEAYKSAGLQWGIGLSPLGVNQGLSQSDRRALRAKLESIRDLQPDIIAVLFDDMSHSTPETAARQLECLAEVEQVLPKAHCMVCPTYYSPDPVLEEVFGPVPAGYVEYYQANLRTETGVFWTGPKVCSERVTDADVQAAKRLWGNHLVLWDNYPVNDGRLRSQHLYLKPLAARETRSSLRGHLCNPMNQLHLSLLGLSGLSQLYRLVPKSASRDVLMRVLGADLTPWLSAHADRFEHTRLDDLRPCDIDIMRQELQNFPGQGAKECLGWLGGEYRFDPSCLTE